LYNTNTYTGATILNGGLTQLLGKATLGDTGSSSSIEISQATLLITNNNATGIYEQQVDNRVSDTAPITMRGGMLEYRARFGTEGTEVFGALTLKEGNSILNVAEPGTGINSSVVTFTSLTQMNRGTLRFLNVDGALGNNVGRVMIGNLNGQPTTTVGDGLINNLIGGWAVFEREFASYTPGTGVGALNGVGYAGYSPNDINSGAATDNIRLSFPGVASTGTIGTNLLTISSTVGLSVGDAVLGTGVPVGATVASIVSGTQFTINQNLSAANPTLNLPQTVTLTNDRTINSLAMVVAGDSTLDLGTKTLTLGSGGLIASQGFDLINPQVTVVTSSTTSNIVDVSSMPQSLVVGSTLLGRTVTAVNGLRVTLDGNANTPTTAPTNRDFVSGLQMPITIQNGDLTAGIGSGAANLYLHALNYLNGNNNVYNRDLIVSARIKDNLDGGAVTLVINGTEGRGTTAGISGLRSNEVLLTGNNTYT
jgi:hypothetical protein